VDTYVPLDLEIHHNLHCSPFCESACSRPVGRHEAVPGTTYSYVHLVYPDTSRRLNSVCVGVPSFASLLQHHSESRVAGVPSTHSIELHDCDKTLEFEDRVCSAARKRDEWQCNLSALGAVWCSTESQHSNSRRMLLGGFHKHSLTIAAQGANKHQPLEGLHTHSRQSRGQALDRVARVPAIRATGSCLRKCTASREAVRDAQR
jgi:hypothetical protein